VGCTVLGSNPDGVEVFREHPYWPKVHPDFCTMGTRALSQRVKWPENGTDHPAPSSTTVKHGRDIQSLQGLLGMLQDSFSFYTRKLRFKISFV
jgi:hypothetical protein